MLGAQMEEQNKFKINLSLGGGVYLPTSRLKVWG